MRHLHSICLVLLLAAAPYACAQSEITDDDEGDGFKSSASASTNNTGPAGIIPYTRGINLSIGTTSQHDSSNGWSSLVTPDIAYRLNHHVSFNVGAIFYNYINVVVTKGTKLKPLYIKETKHFAVGDTSLNGHLEFHPRLLDYNLTTTLGLPSGSRDEGLGAGQVTYAINNHFEKAFGIFTPDLEVGIGDSTSTIGTRALHSYTTLGTLGHFQAGTSVDLPFHLNFSADAYEELPIAAQTLYSTTGRGKKKVTTATGKSVAEDNGFSTSLDIPLNPHVTLSGFYNRSLRSHEDTAGFSFTFLLRPPPRESIR